MVGNGRGDHGGDERTAAWRRGRAGSGVTTRLILLYVQQLAGRGGLEELLSLAAMDDRESELRNENSWVSFEEKIRLWDAAAAVTRDPGVAEHVGESALEFNIGLSLKRALRALGSPDFVYRNVARANSKFNWAHTLEVAEREHERVRLAYRDVCGVGYHHYDCEYTAGLLRTVPQLFGLPPGRVTHPTCGVRGDDHCEFDVRWVGDMQKIRRSSVLTATLGASLAVAGGVVDPVLVLPGAGVAALGGMLAGLRAVAFMRRRIAALETRVRDQDQAAEAQLRSVAALSSELRLDEVLDRITASASTAIGGAQFALLVAEAGGMRADRHSGLPPESLRALEGWAQSEHAAIGSGSVVIDDLVAVPSLRPVAESRDVPLGSACAAPLIAGERLLGARVALAPGATVLLPQDVRALEIYAAHAAIAFSNARLVGQLERDAAEDPLTGLANKRSLELAYAAELSRAAREGIPLAMVVIDLDHFKQINDRFGHAFGDQVLVAVAAALRSAVRAHDIVGRPGGEEFVILLPGADDDEAQSVAERARALIAAIDVPGRVLSSSAGVASCYGCEAEQMDLFGAADRALYEAKRLGRDRTELARLAA